MTILAFPSTVRRPSQATLLLRGMTQSAQSPFDGSVQTLALPGQRWAATLTWQAMPADQYRILAAFLASLAGAAGRFTYQHPMTDRRAPATLGTPLVNGASQSGASLVADGYTASALVHMAGDFISFPTASRQRLHMVTADVTADGSGNATLPIAPPLRGSPADNAAIEATAPLCTWMLSDDDQGEFARSAPTAGARASVSLSLIEALV